MLHMVHSLIWNFVVLRHKAYIASASIKKKPFYFAHSLTHTHLHTHARWWSCKAAGLNHRRTTCSPFFLLSHKWQQKPKQPKLLHIKLNRWKLKDANRNLNNQLAWRESQSIRNKNLTYWFTLMSHSIVLIHVCDDHFWGNENHQGLGNCSETWKDSTWVQKGYVQFNSCDSPISLANIHSCWFQFESAHRSGIF